MSSKKTQQQQRLDVLCLLDSYISAQEKGNNELKSSFWNLNKARRQKGRSCSISALDVREDLVPQNILSEPTPSLTDEEGGGEDGISTKQDTEEDAFTLQNALQVIQESRTSSIAASSNTTTGLRQRKVGSKISKLDEEDESEWTQINYPNNTNEEQNLKEIDPIDLFGGLVPRDLRTAQKQAKEAMESYVEAANLAVAILQATSNQPSTKEGE